MFAKLWLPSSSSFALALGVLGVLPAIPAPWASLSLDTRMGTGIYVSVLAVLVIGSFIADRRDRKTRTTERHAEAASRKLEREELEAKSEQRHLADLAETAEIKRLATKLLVSQDKMFAELRRGASLNSPQIQELAESVRVSAASIATMSAVPPGLQAYTITESRAPIVEMPKVPSSDKPT